MVSYRIVCTDQEPAGASHDAAHIVAVGVGDDPSGADRRFEVDEVRAKIDRGTTFYTKSEATGKTAEVEKYDCSCGYETIRTNPDDRIDNNLDNLRECNWQ
jgi:hypothetical protein